MKNLLDKDAYEEITSRVNKLEPTLTAQWGKMNVAQMQAHLLGPMRVALSDKPMPRMLIGRLIGWMFKSKLYNGDAWKPGLPTAPDFMVKDERDFEKEKAALLKMTERFYSAGAAGVGRYPHPMFGTFTKEQWGQSMYKHMDHHLRQFGV